MTSQTILNVGLGILVITTGALFWNVYSSKQKRTQSAATNPGSRGSDATAETQPDGSSATSTKPVLDMSTLTEIEQRIEEDTKGDDAYEMLDAFNVALEEYTIPSDDKILGDNIDMSRRMLQMIADPNPPKNKSTGEIMKKSITNLFKF